MALVLLLLLPHTMAVRLPRWSIILILHVQLDLIFFVLAPQDLPHREEQEELDWALDQLPHHRTKRSPGPQSCCKSYAALASNRPKHSFYTKRLFYAARIKVRFFCRFLFLTEEKRLVMPPGSQLVLTPTLALPFLR